jgi:hypothetical protein
MFGDVNQIPPIPSTAALFIPPSGKKTAVAKEVLDIFWSDGPDSLIFFMELTIQKRTPDAWYSSLLDECREGCLTDTQYNFLMGLPTKHTGTWLPNGRTDGLGEDAFLLRCYSDSCRDLPRRWESAARQGNAWREIQQRWPECGACESERYRRCRLVQEQDKRVLQMPYLAAPYVHQNNQPKYHAMLLRSVEWAKRSQEHPKQVLWIRAIDTPLNYRDIGNTAAKIDTKLVGFLQFHDQKTAGIPGLLPLYEALRVRTTEKVKKSKDLIILKHTPGTVIGWQLHHADDIADMEPERLLHYLPLVIFVRVDGATFQLPGLSVGVFPFTPVQRTWELNRETGAKISRNGYTLVPDFASTAFMMQGTSLNAMLADCGDKWDENTLNNMIAAYVILSRLKSADGLLLLRAFSWKLFRQNASPGPKCLRKWLLSRFDKVTGRTRPLNEISCKAEDAEAEYISLDAQLKQSRGHTALQSVTWPCGFCGLEFPSEGFGVDGIPTLLTGFSLKCSKLAWCNPPPHPPVKKNCHSLLFVFAACMNPLGPNKMKF